MTQERSRLRTAHRMHAALTITVAITLLVLSRTGVLSGDAALRMFLMIEVPLLLALFALTVLRFRKLARPADRGGDGLLARLETEEPLLLPAIAELRAFGSLCLALFRRQKVPQGARPFGYTRGTATIPAVMIALSLAELVIVHLLVPWEWLRIVLLVLSLWGVLFLLGSFATRVVHPHFVHGEALHVRWGHPMILTTPLANIASVALHVNHADTQPRLAGDRLILTQFQSPNLRICFSEPVAAAPPVTRKNLPADVRVREVQLYADDPQAFMLALRGAA